MKKLLVVLFCLPIIVLGRCFDVEQLIGKKINFKPDNSYSSSSQYSLKKEKLREPGMTDALHTWSYENGVLAYKYYGTNYYDYRIYYLDLNSGYTADGYVKKTWAKNSDGTTAKKTYYNGWRSFRPSQSKTVLWINCIKNFVNNKMKLWEIRGEFEKTVDFKKRVNEASRKVTRANFLNEAIEFYRQEAINSVSPKDISLKAYDADEETFLVDILGYGSFDLPVPISVAPKFKENFDSSNFTNLDLIFKDNKFIISNFEIDGHTYSIRKNVKYDANGMPIE